MYHRIWPGQQDGLTLTPDQLREQWMYLKDEGYRALSMQEFMSVCIGRIPVPDKTVLLTFDDGYRNNLTYVYPLLQELGWCATIFIIGDTLDGTASAEGEEINRKLTVAELKSMDAKYIQLGFHGYRHENFSKRTATQITAIMANATTAFQHADIKYEPILAYPYGARPKDSTVSAAMKRAFKEAGLAAAFRIGNKPERMPAADIYELKRIDIRGEDNLDDFKIKLRKGKLKPF